MFSHLFDTDFEEMCANVRMEPIALDVGCVYASVHRELVDALQS